jgi:mRNA interferase MazF
MTTYKQGDTIVINVPFTDFSEEKPRPALVLSSNEFNKKNKVTIIVPITSSITGDEYEVEIKGSEYQMAGLIKSGVVKSQIILTLDNTKIIRKLGTFPEGLFKKVIEKVLENLSRN